MPTPFELFAFYSNPESLIKILDAQIDAVIIDWENKGKELRQSLYNTQVNLHSLEDLQFVNSKNPKRIICRINGPHYWNKEEFQMAIDNGADEILLPMIKTLSEAEQAIGYINGQADISIMLETEESISIINKLNELPITRFFVGLNDLSIQRNSKNIFLPLFDETVNNLRPKITKKFGIMGLTHPEAGNPIPCSYLIYMMKKLNCDFGILRRSFYRDMEIYGATEIIQALRKSFNDESNNQDYSYDLLRETFLNFGEIRKTYT